MSFSGFILTEKLNHDHAERYLTYIDRYHNEIWTDLHRQLAEAWKIELNVIIQTVHPDEDMLIHRSLRVPDSISEIEVLTTPEKISSTRIRNINQVSPSVKIPYIYQSETIDLIINRFLKVAIQIFNKIASDWSEIFNYEKQGQVKPGFAIEVGDLQEGVKFKITSSVGGEEAYRTIYSVNVEHGRPGSKTKDFDRVYLLSHI